MSEEEVPPLPEGDDPFLLLGLDEATATELSCKRAWTRLIRRYRPDRDPEAFARVRVAYEEALECVAEREARECWENEEPDDDLEDEPIDASMDVPVVQPSATEALSLEEQKRLATREGTSLVALALDGDPVRGGDRDVAHILLRYRVDALLLEGRLPELLAEAGDPRLIALAARDASLAWPLGEVACAAAWRRPGEAKALVDQMVRAGVGGADVQDTLDLRIGTRQAWLAWRAKYGHMETFARLVEFGPALGYAAIRSEARAVAASVQRQPGETMDAFDALGEEDPDLLVQFWEMLEDVRGAGSAEEETRESRRQSPELSGVLRDADKALHRAWGSRVHTWGAIGLFVLTVKLFRRAGVWGWAGVVAALLWMTVGVLQGDARLYRGVLRPRLAAIVAQTGCTAADLLAVLRRVEKLSDDVGRFKDEIKDDASLELLAVIVEVGRGQ